MSARPELGKLTVGQPVVVRRSSNDMRGRDYKDRYIPARVAKIGRVWVDLERSDLYSSASGYHVWRMRMDRQDEASQYPGSNASFATLDQHEWDKTQTWAYGFLRDNRVDILPGSPWRGREVELADLVSGMVTTSPAGQDGVVALRDALEGSDGFPAVSPLEFARRVLEGLELRGFTLARKLP
jgi:hypothetical protein